MIAFNNDSQCENKGNSTGRHPMSAVQPSNVQGKGGGCHPPFKVFFRCFQDLLLLARAVFNDCSFILDTHSGKVWRQSVSNR